MRSSANPDYTIRPMTAQDVEPLAAFLPALLPGTGTARQLRELLHSDHLLRVLALPSVAGTVIAGFAECQQVHDEGHLLAIALAPPWQGRGLGRVLLEGLLRELVILGCNRVLLEVRRSNVRAVHLYEQAGFSLDGVRKHYYPPLALPASGPVADSDAAGKTAERQREDALLYSWSPGLSP